jgi:hypothetical protein
MTTGTITRMSMPARDVSIERTVDSTRVDRPSDQERIQRQFLEEDGGRPLFYLDSQTCLADQAHFRYISRGHRIGTATGIWDTFLAELCRTPPTVWESPKLRKLLADPLGSPIELTPEEADEIVRLAAGRRPDLPKSKEFLDEVRELLGHALMERFEKTG